MRGDSGARAVWTADRLRSWLAAACSGESIVVLANREPFRHELSPDDAIEMRRSGGGVVTALEPVMHACSGVWVAHGSGSADRLVVDAHDGLAVPPANPSYRLRRIWLDADEERKYYGGFSNEGLWPLCHRTGVTPIFRPADFDAYRAVNARFADAVRDEAASERPFILVQDYHFALAPRMLRDRLPRATIVAFWHIPWPTVRDFTRCPWGHHLLRGLLASTIVGFQTDDDRRNFLDTVEALLDADVDRARHTVTTRVQRTLISVYPVSVEFPGPRADGESVAASRAAVRRRLALASDAMLGIGVDRLDYIKGLPEKFLAVERLLEWHPELRGRFAFVQIAEPSRVGLPAYGALREQLRATAARINERFGADGYRPIVLLETRHEPGEVRQCYRAADFCYVGSLQDGMNLVAKEFVAARDDGRGVLVLSERAGAARELTDALLVDPHALDASAQALYEALTMTEHEQRLRMRRLRAVVARWNTFRWAAEMLGDAVEAGHRLPRPRAWRVQGDEAVRA